MKNISSASLLAALVAFPAMSFAGTPTKAAPAPAAPEPSIFSGDIGFNAMTSSYSRGSILGNHGPSIIPYMDLYATAYEGTGFINKIVLGLNVTEYYMRPGNLYAGTGSHKSWYENDFIPSIALTAGKFTLTESYHVYETPNAPGRNSTFTGLNSSLSFDDGDLMGAFALHPSVTYMQKVSGHGNYFEGAVGPGFSMGNVGVAFPMAIGFNGDSFGGTGTKSGWGYFSYGVKLTYTLPVPKKYGTWTANTGLTAYAKDKKVVGGTSDSDLVLSGGLQVAF
ncbi:MAG: hypothetical protein WCO60_06085 [Verrucomicrobiota bacterium]